MALVSGTTLGPYAVTAKIGEGGMGQVGQATDTKLNRQPTRVQLSDEVLPEEADCSIPRKRCGRLVVARR